MNELYVSFSRSLYINLLSLWAILLSSGFCGLCLYSFYKNCDPWMAKMVSAQDQVNTLVSIIDSIYAPYTPLIFLQPIM